MNLERYQNASMTAILVRDLPDDVHTVLRRRASAAGQSLQQYVLATLTQVARTPSLDEVLARIDQYRGGRVGLQTAVEDLDDSRRDRP